MDRYAQPCSMIAGSAVNSERICRGHTLTSTSSPAATAIAPQKAIAVSLRMGAVCCLPQYWLASTIMPLVKPNTSCWRMN